jgi:two-component system chemotaxis family response regulator WspR
MPRQLKSADAAATREYPAMVLLVDDQAIIGEAIRRALASESDIDFHYCSQPEAVTVAERTKPT